MDYKIHVAYGFHVNCYHSYRGDTNDGAGFGSDIRIIREILDVLTSLNEEGIPVKGTWDCENFFSLEKILPAYAPDIIEKMRKRVRLYGDEQIIMGYSNGALSAMNDDEFTASIEKAVTNESGSGLRDLFGRCEMIVRPQEVMFTPSQVRLYNRLGVRAVCLYYSCIPFDAFRTIVPRLDDEQAFNPLTYEYGGESMTVIPTYNNSDICDAGCLRGWVKELRAKQLSGEIMNDLFLFVNMDADAIFWESLDLPLVGSRIANTDGINGLVREIADLDYIVFDTPAGYLKDHGPIGKIEFTQDTADGNFTGYSSWAEKPYNRKIWTAIERARAMSKVTSESDRLSPSFDDRVLLLSTTHFGLATPVLNIQREQKADALANSITQSERKALPAADKITVFNINGTTLQCVQFRTAQKTDDITKIGLKGEDLEGYTLVSADSENGSVFAVMRFKTVKDHYCIEAVIGEAKKARVAKRLDAGRLSVSFSPAGRISEVMFDGKQIGGSDFLKSFITYDGKKYSFTPDGIRPLRISGNSEGLRITGAVHLPGEIRGGSFSYDFFTSEFCGAVFVHAEIKYPHTPERDSISTENSTLGRYSDMKWQETAMLQFTPVLNGDKRVIKRNFSGDISSYRVASFGECDERNKQLDSFNHQLTAGLAGLGGEECTLLLANSRQFLGSMAHCPMRLHEDGSVSMNMFGTYYGKQRHHWSRANGEILDTYTLVTPQGKSLAPAYNGNSENSVIALFACGNDESEKAVFTEAAAFADGAVAVSPKDAFLQPYYEDNVRFKTTAEKSFAGTKLLNPVFSGLSGNLLKYAVKGSKAMLHIVKSQIRSR